MRDTIELREFCRRHTEQSDLIVCTLIRKDGSSYRDVGAKKIVAVHGETSGFLSGGCLEGSIDKTARERMSEMPFTESFSTLSEEDRLLGYQTGCQGVVQILFEKIPRATAWGANLDLYLPFGPSTQAPRVCVHLDGPRKGTREFTRQSKSDLEKQSSVWIEDWVQPLKLFILGCGADADAYLPLARAMGWEIQFLDYRKDLASSERFPPGMAHHFPLREIATQIPEDPLTAVILMTHNYESDLEILRGLRFKKLGYLGCLGPAVRFARLQTDLKDLYGESLPTSLTRVSHAPAGLFERSRSPAEIALSVVAQVQQCLVEKPVAKPWTLILAAGASSRFGSAKAIAPWQGRTLLDQALQTADEFSGDRVMVVTGAHVEALRPYLEKVKQVWNPQWSAGMGTSLAAGVQAIQDLEPEADWIITFPVDQPYITVSHLQDLLSQGIKTERCVLTQDRSIANQEPSHPVGPPAAIAKKYFELAKSLRADRGLKSVLQDRDFTTLISDQALRDIDTKAELAEHTTATKVKLSPA